MNCNKVFNHIKENKWLVAAIVFFILWKFFLIHALWDGRSIPPEPDDSYTYISHIAAISDCPGFALCSSPHISFENSSGYFYLSYRVFLGLLAQVIHLSATDIYRAGFYSGTILLAFTLPFFLRIFAQERPLITWSILFLSLYHGLGEIHGFYWVVPSFFSVLLWLLLAALVLRDDLKFRPFTLFFLSILYTFSHPTSTFLIFILPIYLLVLFLFTQKWQPNVWKRLILVVSVVLVSSVSLSSVLKHTETKKNIYSVGETITKAQTILNNSSPIPEPTATVASLLDASEKNKSSTFFSEKIHVLSNVYFHWIFPHWIFIFCFIICLLILLWQRCFQILSLYIASFIFFLAATFLNPLGYRSAIILWPITYLLFAFGSWYLIHFLQQYTHGVLKKISLSLVGLGLLFFIAINTTFAFIYNENLSLNKNYVIEPSLTNYLLYEVPSDATITLSYELMIAQLVLMPELNPRLVSREADPDYLIMTDKTKVPKMERSWFFQIVRHFAEQLGFHMTHDTAPVVPYTRPEHYTYEKSFGIFDVYRRNH